MIHGVVELDEAAIWLEVLGQGGKRTRVRAIIDTGYNGTLTLPSNVIQTLSLEWFSMGDAVLGDGGTCEYRIFQAAVIWDGRERPIFVDTAECVPLAGMKLMQDYELKINVRERGKVTLKHLNR